MRISQFTAYLGKARLLLEARQVQGRKMILKGLKEARRQTSGPDFASIFDQIAADCRDVLVKAKEIVGVVLFLEAGEPLVV
jgi:hypothetical protein